MSGKKRKSFSLKEKMQVLESQRKSNMSNRKFAETLGLNESMIRRWKKSEPEFRKNAEKCRKIRKIPRERIGYFPEVDKIVYQWVLDRNEKGICVKDAFIRQRARQARDDILPTMQAGIEKLQLTAFTGSKMWCHRFKGRFQLASRRHTTTHTMPNDFREVAIDFITSVQKMCEDYQITRDGIVNFDQVPRYFEMDTSTTIAKKGTREVLLRKSSTSHKRFTFTPFITASGKILIRHALFSNLTKEPKHHEQTKVSVNKTGMWNSDILKKYIDETIRQLRGLFTANKSVLIIFDSYGVHLKFVREFEGQYREQNVHFALIPPRLTGLLQPLDVALNRSFQQFFNDRTSEYQAESLSKVEKLFLISF